MVMSDSEEMPVNYGEDDCCIVEKSSDEGGDSFVSPSSNSKSEKADSRKVTKASTALQPRAAQAVAQNSKGSPLIQSVKPSAATTKTSSAELSSQCSNLKACEFCGKPVTAGSNFAKKGVCSMTCFKAVQTHSYYSAEPVKQPKPSTSVEHKSQAASEPLKTDPSSESAASLFLKRAGQSRVFDWKEYIQKENAVAAPVSCFKHCPLSQCWSQETLVGVKIEIPSQNTEITEYPVYWIASVISVQGYGAQVRYEGYDDDSSHDFMINLGSKDVHPIGWCSANVKPLIPPKSLQFHHSDWKEYLINKLTGSKTLPNNFHSKILNSLKRCPFKVGMKLEVIDKLCLSTMTVAKVEEINGGRLKLRYLWSELEADFFFCHSMSSLIHPIGWSQFVGHQLRADTAYKADTANRMAMRNYRPMEANPDLFVRVKTRHVADVQFRPGMKLEAVDPLNLSSICVATVHEVLKNGYLMIGIDATPYQHVTGVSPVKSPFKIDYTFCYHMSSPYIFPVGFCSEHSIQLTTPKGCKAPFDWSDYLRSTRSVAAPAELFNKDLPKHSFAVGMKLEAVDLMDPKLICMATVNMVVGRLVKISFDGWDSTYDQWMDCQSPDIYPLGWCELLGRQLEGPMPDVGTLRVEKIKKQKKYKSGRKKRKHKQTLADVPPGDDAASQSTEQNAELSDGQSQMSSPAAKKIKLDVQTPEVVASPDPPRLVELSPKLDLPPPQLELNSGRTEPPPCMPNLIMPDIVAGESERD